MARRRVDWGKNFFGSLSGGLLVTWLFIFLKSLEGFGWFFLFFFVSVACFFGVVFFWDFFRFSKSVGGVVKGESPPEFVREEVEDDFVIEQCNI